MKRIWLILLVLLPVNSLLAMVPRPQLHEPSERTCKYVEQALRAFEIPLNSIKIYGFKRTEDNTSLWGIANSDEKFIALLEPSTSDYGITYNSFHEAAHIKDESSKKTRNQARVATGLVGSIWAGTYILLNKTKFVMDYINKHPLGLLAHFFYGGISAISTGWFHKHIAEPWASEQAEYRADKMAIEKLIEQNLLGPICHALSMQKLLEKTNGAAKMLGHSAASEEYKRMKKVAQSNGCEVKESTSNDDLIISLAKNGLMSSATVKNFYSKV